MPAPTQVYRQLGDNLAMTLPTFDQFSPATTAGAAALEWNNRFASLGADFSTPQPMRPLSDPYWLSRNAAMAREPSVSLCVNRMSAPSRCTNNRDVMTSGTNRTAASKPSLVGSRRRRISQMPG